VKENELKQRIKTHVRALSLLFLCFLSFGWSGSLFAMPQGVTTVVIDPGHGRIESGAVGKFGEMEKDINLAISLKLKAIIERNLAFRVVLTRDRDIDKLLEDRAAVANNNKAYVFISIHANSSYRNNAYGSETFFLSLNATDEEARRLAYMENNESHLDEQIASEQEDDIKMILWEMAQTAYIKQSSQLAESVQVQLNSLLKTRNRGIKTGAVQGPDRSGLPGHSG
jgi:N-acetylmuramoyl-L-alanine amidase